MATISVRNREFRSNVGEETSLGSRGGENGPYVGMQGGFGGQISSLGSAIGKLDAHYDKVLISDSIVGAIAPTSR